MASCVNPSGESENPPITNETLGGPTSTENTVLTTGAAMTQDFGPMRNICAHLNAFHAYAEDPGRCVETNHYCGHLNNDVRQCLLYDSPEKTARLIGIEYMITSTLYETLPAEERRLWHSHVYEVKSGMLVMPCHSVPDVAWELAEKKEMEQVIELYGKVYHLWQTDQGHKLPLGGPQLMTSYTADGQFDFEKHVGERDKNFGTNYVKKREGRADIAVPEIHPGKSRLWPAEPPD